jgi:hypothetical protein
MNRQQKYKNLILISLLALIIPAWAGAANLVMSSEKQSFEAGDEFLVELKLDSGTEKINVVDAALNFDPSKMEVRDITTGGSIFNLWTRTPVYSNDSGKVFFTGGTTKNAASGKILSIAFLAKTAGSGEITISSDSSAYLADGKGTKQQLKADSVKFAISERSGQRASSGSWTKLLAADKTPPENLAVTLGEDPSMFGGKYFLSFSATDSSSGLNYFEIQEGDYPAASSESPYVLRDQSLKTPVKIIAVDKAGNQTQSVVYPHKLQTKAFGYAYWAFGALILLLAAAGYFYRRKIKNKNFHNA